MHRILELGSGTGLVGMLVSKLGPPSCVALTDGDEQTMPDRKSVGSGKSVNAGGEVGGGRVV